VPTAEHALTYARSLESSEPRQEFQFSVRRPQRTAASSAGCTPPQPIKTREDPRVQAAYAGCLEQNTLEPDAAVPGPDVLLGSAVADILRLSEIIKDLGLGSYRRWLARDLFFEFASAGAAVPCRADGS
jgi:hypothetical protein